MMILPVISFSNTECVFFSVSLIIWKVSEFINTLEKNDILYIMEIYIEHINVIILL